MFQGRAGDLLCAAAAKLRLLLAQQLDAQGPGL